MRSKLKTPVPEGASLDTYDFASQTNLNRIETQATIVEADANDQRVLLRKSPKTKPVDQVDTATQTFHGEIIMHASNSRENSPTPEAVQPTASTAVLIATQKFFLAEYGPHGLRIFNVIYSFIVSLSFAALTLVALFGKDSLFWKIAAFICGTCSFMNNFPMAIAFNEELVTDYIAKMPSKNLLFKWNAFTSALVGLTTVAIGVKLNQEAAKGLATDWGCSENLAETIAYTFIVFGAINTFATRSVSVARIQNWACQNVRETYLNQKREYKSYFQFLNDMAIYFERVIEKEIKAGVAKAQIEAEIESKTPAEFMNWFYGKVNVLVNEEGLGRTYNQLIAFRSRQMVQASIAFLAFIMMPSWVGISQSGANAIATFLGWGNRLAWDKSASPIEFIAAAGSEALYINSAARYPQALIDHVQSLLKNHGKLMTLIMTALLIAMNAMSGVGMYGANYKQENPIPAGNSTNSTNSTDPFSGYGTLADSTFFSLLFFKDFFEFAIASWAPILMGILAGACINGRSVMGANKEVQDRQKTLKAAGIADASYWQASKAYMLGSDLDSRVYKITDSEPLPDEITSCKNGTCILFQKQTENCWVIHFADKAGKYQTVVINESNINHVEKREVLDKLRCKSKNDFGYLNGLLKEQNQESFKKLETGLIENNALNRENAGRLREMCVRAGVNTHPDALKKGKKERNKQKLLWEKLKEKVQEAIDKGNQSGCTYHVIYVALNKEEEMACEQGKKIIFEKRDDQWFIHYCNENLKYAARKISAVNDINSLNQFQSESSEIDFEYIARSSTKSMTEKLPIFAVSDVIGRERAELTRKEKNTCYGRATNFMGSLASNCFSLCNRSKPRSGNLNGSDRDDASSLHTAKLGYGTNQ
ncbi:MAG: hypothetical protein A3E82_03525 [Gammaproteobacteria bacterium RIFCSPHIGHO2_12_FULL_38_11]|nr:MAG: hypothetical protein A3E82_03525 [Gammaproteobacteria bacterium RIFCSPHIGHO2_12_FULL_38_11]